MLLNTTEWLKKPRIMLGVMTGTSLDGIDIALARFFVKNQKHELEIIGCKTYKMPVSVRNQILNLIENEIRISDVSQLNFSLARLTAKKIIEFLKSINFEINEIDAIAIHGQTVWHEPSGKNPSTMQLCSGSALAALLSKPVISDFRSADVAQKGQGAPLVPIFDYNFLSNETKNRIALNIGGIANITFLPADKDKNKVFAFDTGPGNVWIDMAMQIYFNKKYDKNGQCAKKGNLIQSLFEDLKLIPFIKQKPPKSSGRELFTKEKLQSELSNIDSKYSNEDIIHTLSHFTAWSIAENIRNIFPFTDEIVVSGGGSENSFIIQKLQLELGNVKIIKSDEIGIPSDAKEALCFAYLGWRTMCAFSGNLINVTGATKELILGSVSF